MTDDRDKPKRPKSIMGDEGRIAVGKPKRHTTPRGVPIVQDFVEEEITHPPGPPPQPEQLAELPVEQQIAALTQSVHELSEGLVRVWDARNIGKEFDRMSSGIGMATRQTKETGDLITEFLMPAVKAILPRLDAIERSTSYENGRMERFHEHDWPRVIENLEKIDKRIDGMERHVDRVDRSVEQMGKRWDETTGTLGKRLDDFHSRLEGHALKIRALEDFELSLKVKVALVAGIISLVVGVLSAILVHKLT